MYGHGALRMSEITDATFNEDGYLALNLDVAAAVRRGDFRSGFDHWQQYGRTEQRLCKPYIPEFDELSYLIRYPDVMTAVRAGTFHSGQEHWIRAGQGEQRDPFIEQWWPDARFNEQVYRRLNPDVDNAVRCGALSSARGHWEQSGILEGRSYGAGTQGLLRRDRTPFTSYLPLGVNHFAFHQAKSGLGAAARGYCRVLTSLSWPSTQVEVKSWEHNQGLEPAQYEPAYRINLIQQNADMLPLWTRVYDSALRHTYNIGVWVWELHAAYANAWRASKVLDEVWVPTMFVKRAFDSVCSAPVHVVPYVVEPERPVRHYGRPHFGIEQRAFVFLYTFDLASGLQRKNPLSLLQAFRQRFAGDRRVVLVLKISGTDRDPRSAAILEAITAHSDNVLLLKSMLSEDELTSLYNICDCFVSPHRAEGFGFGPALAMYFSKPTIATGYSGTQDFLNAETGFPVDYELVSVGPGNEPYRADYVWADPDIEHLAFQMHEVFSSYETALRRAECGASMIRSLYSVEAVRESMRRRFERIGIAQPASTQGVIY